MACLNNYDRLTIDTKNGKLEYHVALLTAVSLVPGIKISGGDRNKDIPYELDFS